jgi:flagellar M-ring protein FliF
VAVLIDGVRAPDADGVLQWAPRPEDELEALRALVASAVGYDEGRGDVITLRSLPFEPLPDLEGSGAGGGWVAGLDLDVMGLIRLAALAAVVLFLALFVLRPILRPGARDDEAMLLPGAPQGAGLPVAAGALASGPVLTGEIDDDSPASDPVAPERDTGAPDPIERMRQLIADRQDETLEILRHWMEEPEEPR